jgi:hypothetical protein
MDAIVQAILAASFASAAIAVGSALLGYGRARLQAAQDRTLARVTMSDDPVVLGRLLYSSIGKVHLSAYAADERVRARVDSMIDLLKELGNEDQTEPVKVRRSGSHADQLVELRASIERELRAFAGAHDVVLRRDTGAAMVRELLTPGLIPPAIAQQLMSAISIANRGLHGERVSDAELSQAVDQALGALAQLRNAPQ